jgi:vancomycin resistance protein YoaR
MTTLSEPGGEFAAQEAIAAPPPTEAVPENGAAVAGDAGGAGGAGGAGAEAIAGHPARRRASFLIGFGFGLAAVLALGAGAFAAFESSYAGRVLPGVRVGWVDLSGLAPDQAAGRLAAAFEVLADGELVFAGPGAVRSIGYGELGRRLDVDGLVARAMAVGRSGSAIERLAEDLRTAVAGRVIEPTATYDGAALAHAVALAAADVERDPIDAVVLPTTVGYAIRPAISGLRADRTAAIDAAGLALRDPAAPARVEIALRLTPLAPAVTSSSAIEARAAALRIGSPIVLTDGSDSWTISAATVRSWLSFQRLPDGRYRPIPDSTAIAAVLEPIASAAARTPVSAGWRIEDDRVAAVIPAVTGRALDVPATVAAIERLVDVRRAGGTLATLDLPGGPLVQPALTTAEAEALAPQLVKISTWTTWFPYGIRNGYGANIWIPAGDLEGLVLMPGEWFDFWERIGPVTYERGYREGGAIINGHSEPQGALAGGICSCSTTLFNAAMRAGLEMGARRNHYYYIDRYPLGLDATVFRSSSGSTQTVSFRNDTDAPILISSRGWRSGDKGYVQFSLWSLPTGRTVSLSKPVVTNVKPSVDTIQYTDDLPYGTRDRIEYAVDGMDVSVTRTVRDADGTIIHSDTWVSHYARMTGVTLVGTRGAPAPTPTPEPTPLPTPTASPS